MVDAESCHAALAVMATAGLYDTSGDWLYRVGLPGKSGIGGGIVTVAPGKGALATFAPPLDASGNSVKGQLVAQFLPSGSASTSSPERPPPLSEAARKYHPAMGRTYDEIDGRWRKFIDAQHCFFVATAPLDGGHVNLSPKGMAGTFAVVDERTVAYLDLNGSGIETVAHIRENGRVTIMFCAFDGPPKILRLYGTGRVYAPTTTGSPTRSSHFPPRNGCAP